jgi:hypothetical protein
MPKRKRTEVEPDVVVEDPAVNSYLLGRESTSQATSANTIW